MTRKTKVLAASELFFVILPLFILVLVCTNSSTPHHQLLSSPEWSFASSILFGEALTRITIANVKHRSYSPQRLFLLLAILLSGLIAAIVLLVLVLVSAKPSLSLQVEQILLFVAGCVGFVYFAGLSHEIEESRSHK